MYIIIISLLFVFLFASFLNAQSSKEIKRLNDEIQQCDTSTQYEKIANLYNDIAAEYHKNFNYLPNAIENYKKSAEYSRNNSKKYKAYKTISQIHGLLEKRDEELEYLTKAVSVDKKVGIMDWYTKRMELCKIYYNKNDYNKVVKFGTEALEISFFIGSLEYANNSIDFLINSYQKLENTLKFKEYTDMSNINDLKSASHSVNKLIYSKL